MNLFENNNLIFDKLMQDYHEHGNLVIGVDFDDTIRDWDTGKMIEPVVDTLKMASSLNCKICLYTCREDIRLLEALEFCGGVGIKIDYINSSPVITHTRKPLFNILLDDRAGLVESLDVLKRVINQIKLEK